MESQAISLEAMQARLDYFERVLRARHGDGAATARDGSDELALRGVGLSPIQPVQVSTPAPAAAAAAAAASGGGRYGDNKASHGVDVCFLRLLFSVALGSIVFCLAMRLIVCACLCA